MAMPSSAPVRESVHAGRPTPNLKMPKISGGEPVGAEAVVDQRRLLGCRKHSQYDCEVNVLYDGFKPASRQLELSQL